MSDPLFGPEVRLLLDEDDTSGMKAFCETLHPATVAEALAGIDDVNKVWQVLQQTGIRHQATIFEYLPIEKQVEMVKGTGRQHMAKLVEQMSHDDRVDLLRRLMPRVADELLRLVDEADRRDIASLTRYGEHSAGGLMTTDYAWVPPTVTVGEALDRLRLQAPDRETIYYVYVLDDQRKLQGMVSLRQLILAPRHVLVRDLISHELVAARVTDDPEHVAQELARYDFIAMPVVDEEGRMVGIITHDDLMDVVVQEATEDVHSMGAVVPIAENYLQANFFTVWWKRASWLACLFLAELFTFTALSHFERAIEEIVVLALFVPLCISTGGNSGSQAATLITRAIALGQLSLSDWFRVLRHELMMGIALGLALGGIAFVRGAMTPEETRSDEHVRETAFEVRVPRSAALTENGRGQVTVPPGSIELAPTPLKRSLAVRLPDGVSLGKEADPDPEYMKYVFPKESVVREAPVGRAALGWVLAQAVAAICLWGTLVGSMLPIIFKRIGIDPGIASSPFVATFVDVTGIFIYFSIAKIYLL